MKNTMESDWIRPKPVTKESARTYSERELLKKLDYQTGYEEAVQKINHAIRLHYPLMEIGVVNVPTQPILSCAGYSAILGDLKKAYGEEGFDIDFVNNSTMFSITLKR